MKTKCNEFLDAILNQKAKKIIVEKFAKRNSLCFRQKCGIIIAILT